MFAAKFLVKRLPFMRLPLFCPISSFVQVRFQRAEEVQSRSQVEFDHDDEPLPFDQIPGPQGRYATAVEFYRQSNGFKKFYKIPEKLFKIYGPIFKQHVTDETPVVHIMEPADFETVYGAEGKYPIRPTLDFMIEHRKRNAQPCEMIAL